MSGYVCYHRNRLLCTRLRLFVCLDKLVEVLFEDILIYCNSKEEQVECLRIELQVLQGNEVLC